MIGRRSYWLPLFVLVAWIILGPIGMVFESCAAMMALCDGGPCGAVTALVSATPTVAAPVPLSEAPALLAHHPITVLPSSLEPPPKLLPLSA